MAWSTRELAQLAGTTLRAVRHYQELGLLPEPPRGANGYKRYGVAHLTQLIRIRQLTDLGAPLSQIRTLDLDDERSAEALRALDADAEATIERMTRVRREIADLLATAEERTARAADAEPADRDLMVVLSTVLDPDRLAAWESSTREVDPDGALAAFSALDPEASEGERADLAERVAIEVRALQDEAPLLRAPLEGAPHGRPLAARSIQHAIAELYSPAQRDVLARAERHLAEGDG